MKHVSVGDLELASVPTWKVQDKFLWINEIDRAIRQTWQHG
jgi:hypothetical protein